MADADQVRREAGMMRYGALRGYRLRRHRRLIARVAERGRIWVTHEPEFRMVERMHRAGVVAAAVSKWRMFGPGRRPFRELAVFATEAAARTSYRRILPRSA